MIHSLDHIRIETQMAMAKPECLHPEATTAQVDATIRGSPGNGGCFLGRGKMGSRDLDEHQQNTATLVLPWDGGNSTLSRRSAAVSILLP